MTNHKQVLPEGYEWKQFLNLGERLLKQSNTAAQCQLIEKLVLENLGIHVLFSVTLESQGRSQPITAWATGCTPA